ncbi:hypothetical protein GV794_23600 [Nocardia cyriacigeorgica]|uniref:Uncharacterized protein n=1 Tax=Nocardia cyriacigeorgica TaxID=135487 RepID=A0A6P1D8W7_9NOCA|nr:hypothetical protein [Nocardia cyriacigeorgica]NEW38532.1 hypothetical protein [Nocardia cyriacigeorgica]NEW46089.1 hypothetical protein [Nocardia cyriacigeorgica]NEW49559.1 hypothetical protein [Nocardia cyriacigeorgica]NEW58606.1 hypothetical protein [Nocardia cyriacigeorgica]
MRWRLLDLARAVPATLIASGFAWVAVHLLDWYELAGRTSTRTHDLTAAYSVAAVGFALATAAVAATVLGAVKGRRPIGWAPLVGVPLFAGVWVCGFLVAILTAPG